MLKVYNAEEIETTLAYMDRYPNSGQNKEGAEIIRKLQADNLRLTNGCNALHRKLDKAKKMFHISEQLLGE